MFNTDSNVILWNFKLNLSYPSHVRENLGCHKFFVTNTTSFTQYNGKEIFGVYYQSNEVDQYNSFSEFFNSEEELQEFLKYNSIIEKQIFIDATSVINYVDKNVTEEEFITQERK